MTDWIGKRVRLLRDGDGGPLSGAWVGKVIDAGHRDGAQVVVVRFDGGVTAWARLDDVVLEEAA